MIPYILFVILILLFYNKRQPKLIVMTLVIFAALRYDTGWDYMSYYRIGDTYNGYNEAIERYSFLWRPLFSFAYNHNMPHVTLAVPALLTYPILYKGICLLTEDKRLRLDALLVYSFWPFFYLASLSEIRQSLALAISVLIAGLVWKDKKIGAFVLAASNCLVHPSAFIAFVFFYFFNPRVKLDFRKTLIFIIAVLVGCYSFSILITIPPFNVFAVYAMAEDNFGGKLSYLLMAICIYLLFGFIMQPRKGTIVDSCYSVALIGLVGSVAIYMSSITSVAVRILQYCSIFMTFVFLTPLSSFKDEVKLRRVVTTMLIFLMLWYLMATQGAEDGSSQYVPYKSIIFR